MQRETFRHLDLFSGIGGFALAAEMAFENVQHIFCDNDAFSQAIIRKHWPNAKMYGDIKELTVGRIAADSDNGHDEQEKEVRSGREAADTRDFRIDLITGGFPCQPFSAAGRRKGTEDDRHLWPEMLRLIRETNPTYVLGENVGGFLTWDGGMVLEMVLSDLEEAGYEAGAFVIPACAVGAPHRRDRVWIAAHAVGSDARGKSRTIQGTEGTEGTERLQEWYDMAEPGKPGKIQHASNAEGQRRGEREGQSPTKRTSSPYPVSWRSNWTEHWLPAATRLCAVDDGLPDGLARPRGWRNAALKGAGNAIVPQVAAEILAAMRSA